MTMFDKDGKRVVVKPKEADSKTKDKEKAKK